MEEQTVEEAQREWPRYQSFKQVHALKLSRVEDDVAVGHTRFIPQDTSYAPVIYPNAAEPVKRCQATRMGDPGYLVTYEDGFVSWSPTKAFEGGYSLIVCEDP